MVILAGVLAAVIGFVELVLSLPKSRPLSVQAWHWVLARVAADFIVAAIAFALVAVSDATEDELVTVLIAAGSGSIILRAQVSVARREGSRAPVGLVVAYELLRNRSSERIESINAAAQTDWLMDDVLPYLMRLEADEIRQRALLFVKTLPTKKLQTQGEAFIESTLASSLTDDEQRLHVAQYLIDVEGRDMVKSLAKAGKRKQ